MKHYKGLLFIVAFTALTACSKKVEALNALRNKLAR